MTQSTLNKRCNLIAILLSIVTFNLVLSINNHNNSKHQDRRQLQMIIDNNHTIQKRDVLSSSDKALDVGKWKNPCKSDIGEELITIIKEGYDVKKNDTDTVNSIKGKFMNVMKDMPQRALLYKQPRKFVSKRKPLTVARLKRSLKIIEKNSPTPPITTKQDCCGNSYINDLELKLNNNVREDEGKSFSSSSSSLEKESTNSIGENEIYSGKKSAILFKKPRDKNYGIKKTSFSIVGTNNYYNRNSPSYLNKMNGFNRKSNNRYFYTMQPTSVGQLATTTILLDNDNNSNQTINGNKLVNNNKLSIQQQTKNNSTEELRELFSTFLLNKFKIALNSNYALKHVLSNENLYYDIIDQLSLQLNNVTINSTNDDVNQNGMLIRKANNTYGNWLPELNNLTSEQNEPNKSIELLFKLDKQFQYYAVAIEQMKTDQGKYLHGIDYVSLEESTMKNLCQIKTILNIIRDMLEIQKEIKDNYVSPKKDANFDRYIQFLMSQITSNDFYDFEKVYYSRDVIISTFRWVYRQNENFKLPEENKREIVDRSVMPANERTLSLIDIYHRDFNIMNSLKVLGDIYKSVLSHLQNEHMISTST